MSQHANFDRNTVRSWISACHKGHQNCRTNSDVVLPSRLIDVSRTNSHDSVSLHIPSEGERGSYAALSYCWGEGDRPTLKVGTLKAFLQRVWIPDLPKTYTDAIEVIRALGLKYLWIDAICIIQDDPADKIVEVPRMHQYYRNALFVISATNAEHVREGFLTRSADIPKTYRLPHLGVIQSRIQEIPVVSRSGKHARAYLTAENSVYAAGSGSIASRGWTLQEHALPDVLLEFPSPEGFVFSCATEEKHNEGFRYSRASYISGVRQALLERRRLQAQGNSPPMLDQDYGSWNSYLNTSEKRGHTPAETLAAILTLAQMNMPESQKWNSTPADRIYDSWNSMVTNYGCRNLKEHGDRLIAISALADEFKRLYGEVTGEYRAGLWERFLPHSLTWVVHETGIRPAPNSRISPSWSWAAVFGAGYSLQFSQRLSAISLISILKCETNLSEPTLPFGSVRQGTLTVKGRAKLTDTWKSELDGKTYLYGEADSEGNNRWVISLDSMDHKIYIGGPVFILPIFLLPVRFPHEASKPPKYTCLLLKLREGNTCCRIGIATSFYIHKASYEAWNERVFRIT
ncbi:uncharacterized protein A1O9_01912 [Exophiala aquamarina CBS 119918]|uniref:Heterokaryon incompatibility domain-containing protein n=1 Tax=Exophiala aquamarina CBS 119918 TaxID=1182545 RepID=A0A072PKU5_9EURO|nr:uncharacterized protein A1O9_01912 [Exophiala aquamarina CBS 119918]KEF60352.1 hypothetical protein A1O9_01912 [Exophiala aquamarina CBS 119918]